MYGQSLYYVAPSGIFTLVGTITPSQPSDATPRNTPVSMADNGVTMILVDGSVDGWTINLAARGNFTRIVSENFYGADYVAYLSTFFILNKKGSPIFYISGSEDVTFDGNDAASKLTQADNLVAAIAIHSVMIMVGELSWESWQLTGGDGTAVGSFPLQVMPGDFANFGCAAQYSLTSSMNFAYWLSRDAAGQGIFVECNGYNAKRISTFAIENALQQYSTIDDAVSYIYQQDGHRFLVTNFPSANNHRGATWVYDITTEQWHERAWIDDNGTEFRHRVSFATEAYGKVYAGDWENANLYTYDLANQTDNGQPIKRVIRSAHERDTDANKRVGYTQLIANFETGNNLAEAAGPPTDIIDTSFDATDGTLLQNFYDYQDIGATFTKISGVDAEIISDRVVAGSSGSTLYSASGTPTSADYALSFKVYQDQYASPPQNGSVIFAIGRANSSHNGYKASVISDGSALSVQLTVMPIGTPSTVALGTLSGGFYTVTLSMVGSSVTVGVQKSSDGKWLAANAAWVGSPTKTISVSSSTYTLPGQALIGGTWI